MKKKTSIIFDFDGVIVDSMPRQESAWQNAIQKAKVSPVIGKQLIDNLYAGHAGSAIFTNTSLSEGLRNYLRQEKDAIWLQIQSNTPLFPSAKRCLQEISRIAKLGIATTAPRDYVEKILGREELLHLFQVIASDTEQPYKKPAREFLVSIIENELSTTTQECLMIGDSLTDFLLAQNSQVDFILFGEKADLWAKNCKQVSSWPILSEFISSLKG